MIVTMNARELNHFFNLRCCNRASREIREVAEEMLRLVYPVAPHLFKSAGPSCVCGTCPEGNMSCGKAKEMREKYNIIKMVKMMVKEFCVDYTVHESEKYTNVPECTVKTKQEMSLLQKTFLNMM